MSTDENLVEPEVNVKRTRLRKQKPTYAELASDDNKDPTSDENIDFEGEKLPKKRRKTTRIKTSTKSSTINSRKSTKRKNSAANSDLQENAGSDTSFVFSSDSQSEQGESNEEEKDVYEDLKELEQLSHTEKEENDFDFKIEQPKINFDLTEKDVNENFFDAKLVGSTSGLTEGEIGFFIEYVEKYMSVKKMKGSNVTQQKNLVKFGGMTIKQRSSVHERKINHLLPLPTEMTNYALLKFEALKKNLENMDKESLMMNYNPTMAFYRSRNVTKSVVKGKATTEALLKETFAMPVILDNDAFKKVEEKIITNELEPFLEKNMFPNFKKKYTQFTLELMAGKSLCFYGLGNKKVIVLDFCYWFIEKMNKEVYNKERVELCVIDGLTVPSRYNSLYANVKAFLGVDPFQIVAFEKTLHKEKKQLWGDHALRELEILIKFYNYCKNSDDPNTQRQADIKLVLLIHNADSEMFRKPSYKKFMSVLARVPVIKLIFTVDGVKYPLSVDKSLRDDLNVAMHPLTTLKPYDVEGLINQSDRDRFYALFDTLFTTASGNSGPKRNTKLVKGPSVYDTKSGLANIFASISKKNLKIFKLLMQNILERKKAVNNKQSKSYRVPFRDFLATCQQHLLASNEMTLRTALIEFTTHSLCILADKKRLGYDLLDTTYTELEIEHMLQNQLKDI